jgi:tRNA pseudouridine38-40 synthase
VRHTPWRDPLATTRWLVRFGYDGSAFAGWARQPRLRTVEGEILPYLARHRVLGPNSTVAVASRTDRGVSAVGNALTVESPLSGPALLRTLNGISPDLFFTAATEVPSEFRVRGARRREYRYYEPTSLRNVREVAEATRLFRGTVDVRSFGRGLPMSAPVWRSIDSVDVHAESAGAIVEIQAKSFVWGMVRKIVAALREVDAGRLALPRLAAALGGQERLTLPLAEPEPLVLWTVEHDVPWTHRWSGPNRHQARWWSILRGRLASRQRVLDALAEGRAGPDRPAPSAEASADSFGG